MGKRGRTSETEIATRAQAPVSREQRPSPPIELTSEQSEVWWAIMDGYPASRFEAGLLPVLADYCKHTVSQRRVGQLIELADAADEFDFKEYRELLKQQREESKTKATLARALGIAEKSVYKPKGGPKGRAPWQYEG